MPCLPVTLQEVFLLCGDLNFPGGFGICPSGQDEVEVAQQWPRSRWSSPSSSWLQEFQEQGQDWGVPHPGRAAGIISHLTQHPSPQDKNISSQNQSVFFL